MGKQHKALRKRLDALVSTELRFNDPAVHPADTPGRRGLLTSLWSVLACKWGKDPDDPEQQTYVHFKSMLDFFSMLAPESRAYVRRHCLPEGRPPRMQRPQSCHQASQEIVIQCLLSFEGSVISDWPMAAVTTNIMLVRHPLCTTRKAWYSCVVHTILGRPGGYG